jgi:ligand-binding sensor domain-containing protein
MKLLLSVLSIFLFSSATAQDYFTNFKEYGARDGFNAYEYSGTPVKDKKGFLWIGTDNGLYRFDGQNFKAFLHDPADSFSLPSDNNGVIFIERDGTFWINNDVKGVSHFDPGTQKFHRWQNANTQEIDISKHQVNKIFQDSKERMWISVFGIGLGYLNKKDNTLKLFSFYTGAASPKWESAAYINDIAEDNNHEFWIATHDGLVHFNPETKAFKIFKDSLHSKENNGRHSDINAIHIGYDGMIWTGTWGAGLKKFDPQKKPGKPIAGIFNI